MDLGKSYIPRINEFFATQPVADRAFVDAIIEDRPISPSFYDGYKVQQVLDAAVASHEQGRWITLS